MVGPSLRLVGGNSRQHLAAPAVSKVALDLNSAGKRSRKNFVDPCALAPLKKRRIQVSNECGFHTINYGQLWYVTAVNNSIIKSYR